MKTLVISEIGVNHNGSLALAYKMIEKSKWAGADVAKFQFYNPDKVLGKNHPLNAYAWSCQFSKAQLEILKEYCDQVGIEFLVSVFDIDDLAWANSLCKRIKVATRMSSDAEFIAAAKATKKPVMVSKHNPYMLLHPEKYVELYCIAKYPTELEEVNREVLKVCEGFSTHCPDIAPALFACSYNCKIVEAHTTLDRTMSGCDHSSSWTYDQMKQFVDTLRSMERLGK